MPVVGGSLSPRGLVTAISAAQLLQIVLALAIAAIVQLHLRRWAGGRGEKVGFRPGAARTRRFTTDDPHICSL
jgi:hypothetical protein